jgi:hypothetical protein
MLSIPHSLVGAYIASKLPSPILYVPLTLGMHYLCDWIPHWDVGTGLSVGKRKRSTAILLEIIDLALTIGIIYWFFFKDFGKPVDFNVAYSIHIWTGALMGIAPDLVEAPRNFLKWEPRFIKPLNAFHGNFHHSTPNVMIGIVPQIILVVVIWLLK